MESSRVAARNEIRELHRIRPRKNLVILLFVAIWIACASLVVTFPVWPVRIAGYVLIGASINALGILMHEAIHGSLFRRRRLDRWIRFLLGVPTGVSCHAYRVTHLLHHRHNRGALDPDEFSNLSRNRTVLSVAFYLWLLVGGFVYLLHLPLTAMRRGTARDRATVALEYLLIGVLYAAAVRLLPGEAIVHGWLLPLLVVVAFTNLRGWAEHALTEPGDPLTETRTVTSNRLVSFFMCNLNYHLEHHLYPGVPWYNLRRLHLLLRSRYDESGAVVCRSYLGFLWTALRRGVHGATSRTRRGT
jgi:fatty acid desaturase